MKSAVITIQILLAEGSLNYCQVAKTILAINVSSYYYISSNKNNNIQYCKFMMKTKTSVPLYISLCNYADNFIFIDNSQSRI